MLVWWIASGIGVLAGILVPSTWLLWQEVQGWLFTEFGAGNPPFFLPLICATAIFFIHWLSNTFRTADSFTYFFSDLHYRDGQRDFFSAFLHGISSFLFFLGGAVVGLEAVAYEWLSSLGSKLGRLVRLPGMQVRSLAACGLAGSLAAMFELPVPAIFFVVEIFLGWSGLASIIGPVALTAIIAAGISGATTGPVGYFHLIHGADGGLALSLRGASLELGMGQAALAFLSTTIIASGIGMLTIWIYHRTDYILQMLLIHREDRKWVTIGNAVRLFGWALITILVSLSIPEATGLGVSLLQSSLLEKGMLATLLLLAARLCMGAISYCALGSIGTIWPTLIFGTLLGTAVGTFATSSLGISPVHMGLLMMGGYFSAVFGAPISSTALVFSYASGTSSENFLFLLAAVATNFLTDFICGFLHKERLATQGLYRHEMRFRNGLCFNTLSALSVKDALVPWVAPVPKHTSLHEAYKMLMDSRFLKLPVVDDQKDLVGVLSLADFYQLVAWQKLSADSQVHELLGIEDIMKPVHKRIDSEMNIEQAFLLMGDEDIVSVVEANGNKLAGILLKSDLIHLYNKEIVKKASGRGSWE